MGKRKISICFISRQAYSYLSKKNFNSAGGAELQETLLAKEFLKRGADVSFVVGDYGQDDQVTINGLEIHKGFFSYGKGIFNRILEPISFWNLLSKINADIYYRRTPHNLTLIIGLFCKIKRKKFIFAAGSDSHFREEGLHKMGLIPRIVYKSSSKLANLFIVQNSFQKEEARKILGINAIIIKNLMELPKEISCKTESPIVLFVGSILDYKRPGIFMELARTVKNTKFYFIGPCNDKNYYDSIKRKSRKITNLKFCDYLPREKILELYEKDIILVNTSKFEGFPNTFLEAWSYGNPVISLDVDPDEVICKYKLGFHSRTFDKMTEDLNKLVNDKKLREELGKNGRRYVEQNHSINKILDEFEKFLKDHLQ